MTTPVTLAAVDAGSNAIRAIIARASSATQIQTLFAERVPVRLGRRAFTRGELDPHGVVDEAVNRVRSLSQAGCSSTHGLVAAKGSTIARATRWDTSPKRASPGRARRAWSTIHRPSTRSSCTACSRKPDHGLAAGGALCTTRVRGAASTGEPAPRCASHGEPASANTKAICRPRRAAGRIGSRGSAGASKITAAEIGQDLKELPWQYSKTRSHVRSAECAEHTMR